ncbi:MAG: hypothetical protein JSS82_10690 [Bacteroidetes bacterium]|nr:hypothetical protein [Bacteroidota bacterium]
MRNRNFLISIHLLLIFRFTSDAQTFGWHEPANLHLPAAMDRFEDIYFLDTNIGYGVIYERFVMKTLDGGASWDTLTSSPYAAYRCVEFTDDGKYGIAGTLNSSATRTTDYGQTWTLIDLHDSLYPDPSRMCGITHIGYSFLGVGWWGSDVGRFYKSGDAGATWSTTYIDTSLATGLVDICFFSADTGFITGCKNTTGNIYTSNESVILKTTDGGATWSKVFSDTVIAGRVWKIQFLNRNVGFASIEPYYDPDTVNILKTVDGGNSWSMIPVGRIHNNTFATPIGTQGVGFATEQKGWVGGWYSGVFQTLDGGVTWDSLAFGGNFNRFQRIDSTHIFAGGRKLYKWTDSIQAIVDTDTVTRVVTPIKPRNTLYTVSPNPTDGKLKITYELGMETNVVLEIANVDMRRHVQLFNKHQKAGHYTYTWDGSGMPEGNYIIWLGTDEIPLVQKFTIERQQ